MGRVAVDAPGMDMHATTSPSPSCLRRLAARLLHPGMGAALAIAGAATSGRPALACLWWSVVGPADAQASVAFRALCADAPQLMAHGIALGGCVVGLVWAVSLLSQSAASRPR